MRCERAPRVTDRRPRGRGRAFTLIELMMVLAILGITAAIVTLNFASGVDRLEYNNLVRSTHGLFSRARAAAIIHNAAQVVVCDGRGQRLIRRARTVRLEGGPRVVEEDVETLDLPFSVVTLQEWQDGSTGSGEWRELREGREYLFLPDGLGDSYRPLKLGLLRGERLAAVRRSSRGRVNLAMGRAGTSLDRLFEGAAP